MVRAQSAQSLNLGISLQESYVYHHAWDFTESPKTEEELQKGAGDGSIIWQ